MTSPLPAADTAGSPGITPDAVVLQNRALLPGTHAAGLSRFGDSIWDLYPALHDQHASNQKIHWDTYPEPFRLACKYYVFALLNVTDHPPRLAFAHADVPGVKTIWAELGYLRLMLTWLLERGIRQFADVTTTDLDIYLNTVTSDDASSTSRKTKTLRAVLRLHAYRQHMPASGRLPEPVPWGGISAAELAQHTDPRRAECRTARIHPDIMQTLLSAALLTIETIAPDLLPAIQGMVTLRATALRLPPPSPGSSRWYSTADRLTTFLGALERDSHPLPGISSGDSTIIDLTGLAFAGADRRRDAPQAALRGDPGRRPPAYRKEHAPRHRVQHGRKSRMADRASRRHRADRPHAVPACSMLPGHRLLVGHPAQARCSISAAAASPATTSSASSSCPASR